MTGDKVWIFVKSGKGLSTVQMINMIGINASWHNEEGDVDNKTPYAQENLTVRLSQLQKVTFQKGNLHLHSGTGYH